MPQLREFSFVGNELRRIYEGEFERYLSVHDKDFAKVVYNDKEFKAFLEWFYRFESITRAYFIRAIKNAGKVHFIGVFKKDNNVIENIVKNKKEFLNDNIYNEVEINGSRMIRKTEHGNGYLGFKKGDKIEMKVLKEIIIFRYISFIGNISLIYVVKR